jgi:polysaccharide pyruvyl transferase WcaK-like protein
MQFMETGIADSVLLDPSQATSGEPRSGAGMAPGRRERLRIGLLEHCGTGNLGDDATIVSELQQIKRRWPEALMIGLSLDPADSERRLGIPSFAIRQSVYACKQHWCSEPGAASAQRVTRSEKLKGLLRKQPLLFAITKASIGRLAKFVRELVFLVRSVPVVRKLDLLVIAGGGQLLDSGGPWDFPFTLFKWVTLAKFAGTKCYFLNNGAGPLDHALSRWFVRRCLSLADYVSFRDSKSGALIRSIGFQGGGPVVADCVWGLQVPDRVRVSAHRRPSAALTVGVAPMGYCDPTRHWVKDEASYRKFIDKMAEFGARLLARGHRLSLFSSDIWFDSRAIADLQATLRERHGAQPERIEHTPVADIDDLLARLAQTDCYVTCRFHGVIFAHLLDVPALAIAPHPKVTTLMEDAGMPEYCVDVADWDVDTLVFKFEKLVGNMDGTKSIIRRKVAAHKDALAAQFDELFS